MHKKNRTKELSLLAYNLKMEFCEQEDYSNLPYLSDFKLFDSGRSKKVYNILSHNNDSLETKVNIFDYQYKPHGKNKKMRYQTVFFINSKSLSLPDFNLIPETFFHKLISKLGFEDIDFKSHQKFSDKYHLKGEDEERIRDTFSEPILQYFTFNKNWHMEGVGYYLILYKHNYKTTSKEVNNLYCCGMKMFDFFKLKEELL